MPKRVAAGGWKDKWRNPAGPVSRAIPGRETLLRIRTYCQFPGPRNEPIFLATNSLRSLTYAGLLPGKDVYAVNTVAAGCLFLAGSLETVETFPDGHVAQTVAGEGANELCFQQSARNSTRPKLDVGAGIVRELRVQGNIRNLDPPAGL